MSGRSVPVLQGLLRPVAGSLASGTANYDVAHNGALAYAEGRSFLPRSLVWLDRKGAKVADTEVRGPRLVHPEVSPGDASVAYAAAATGPGDLGVWSQSFTSGARTLLGTGYRPIWAPDESEVAFNSGLNGDIIVRQADGMGQGEPVVATPAEENVGDWSSDGKYLLFDHRDNVTGWDLWSPKGDELFYLERDTLMRVAVSTNGEFSHGVPQPLFQHPGLAVGLTDVATYDVSRDGQRFLVVDEGGEAQASRIVIVENWLEELKRLVPTN